MPTLPILRVYFANCGSGVAKRGISSKIKKSESNECYSQLELSAGHFRWSPALPSNQASIRRVVFLGGQDGTKKLIAIDCITALSDSSPSPKFVLDKVGIRFALPMRCLLNSCGAVTLTGILKAKKSTYELVSCQFSYLGLYSPITDELPFCYAEPCTPKKGTAFFLNSLNAISFDKLLQVLSLKGIDIDTEHKYSDGFFPGDDFVIGATRYSPDVGTGSLQAIKVFATKESDPDSPATIGFLRRAKHTANWTRLPPWVKTKFDHDKFNVVQRHVWGDGTLVQSHRWQLSLDFFEGSFFELWNESVARPHLNSLRHVPGAPITLVPLLDTCDGGGTPCVASVSSVFDTAEVPLKGALQADDFTFLRSQPDSTGAKIGLLPVGIQPGSPQTGFSAFACAQAMFPGFIRHDGQPFTATHAVTSTPNLEMQRIGFGIKPWPGVAAATQLQHVRLGALDLVFSDPANVAESEAQSMSALLRQLPAIPSLTSHEPDRNLWIADFRTDFKVMVRSIDVGGQDTVPTEAFAQANTSGGTDDAFEREKPVVFAVSPQTVNEEKFLLDIKERSDANTQRRIDLDIETQQSGTNDAPRVVVIDRNPFLVAEVEFPDFHTQQADASSSVLASWANAGPEGPVWQIRAGKDQSATLVLPPQAVGETMQKDQRLDNQKAKFTLSPPMVTSIRPSYNTKRFVEAPWNLRRILGYVGQRSPGAQVNTLQFEMLYGLSCLTDYPFLRLAEIATQVGSIPGQVPGLQQQNVPDAVQTTYDSYSSNWKDIYKQYKSRLGILQPWDSHQNGALLINTQLSCDIRVPVAKINRPVTGVCDPPIADDFDLTNPDTKIFGGVVGGFESNNIYCAVMRNPHSTGASLTNPAFSSLGGFGTTMGEFDKGLSRMSAAVRMGRTETYTLERFGRVAVLWNKAKHVIVYQRSADQGEQFDDPASLRGRPVLRKISEYIELIDKERHYPEHEAAPAVRGFVASSDFRNALRINVDGKWGRDVGNRGWKIPLWNAAAAIKKETVYAKPRISLGVVCDDGGKAAILPCDLDRPDQLYFYTSTEVSASGNSDEWPAVPEIDFPNFPIPPCPVQRFPNAQTDHSLSPESQPGGYENFTFRLAPSSRAVNIVAERSDSAISALLRNVTLARSAGSSAPVEKNDPRALPNLLNDAYNGIVDALPRTGNISADDMKNFWKQHVTDPADAAAAKITHDVMGGASKVCDFVKGQADTALQSFFTSASGQVQSLSSRLVAFPQEIRSFFDSVKAKTDKWSRQDLVAEIDARFSDLKQQLHWWPLLPEPLAKIAQGVADWIASAKQLLSDYDANRNILIANATAVIGANGSQTISAAAANSIRAWTSAWELKITGMLEALRNSVEYARPVWLPSCVLPTYAAEQQLRSLLLPHLENVAYSIASTVSGISDVTGADVLKSLNALPSADTIRQLPVVQTVLGKEATWAAAATLYWDEWIDKNLQKIHDDLLAALPQNWPPPDLSKALNDAASGLEQSIGTDVQKVSDKIQQAILGNGKTLEDNVDNAITGVCQMLSDTLLPSLAKDWSKFIPQAGAAFEEVRKLVDNAIKEALADARPILEQAARLPGTIHIPGDALRILRCFGEPPRVPGLDFNRDRLAYFFNTNAPAVDLSPVLALADSAAKEVGSAAQQAAKAFQAFGLTLPSTKLLDRIIPHSLSDFDLSSIFRDFAGIKLDGLFPAFRLPKIDGDTGVQVRHGVDPQSKRAWMSAHADVPITSEQSLLAFGPLELSIIAPHFEADARIEIGVDGSAQRSAHGTISGDWALRIGGTEMVRFQQTRMLFDESGNVRFEISASNVRLAPAFAFLNSFLSKAPGSGSGFSIEANLPSSVVARLDLGLPDLNLGTIGISNLRLGCSFALEFAGGDFALALNFALASRKAPFTLSIFILGGSGFIESSFQYIPSKPHSLSCRVDVGLMASATLSIALGPIRGGVYLYFGVTASLQLGGDDPRGFAIGIMILIRGVVSLLGIVDASLSLMLEASYDTGSKVLQGRGRLEVSIKICWCFTLNISEEVHCELRPGGLGSYRYEPVLVAANTESGIVSDGGLAFLPATDTVTRNLAPRCDSLNGQDPIQFYLTEYFNMMEY